MRGPAKSEKCPPHEPNGYECLVAHGDRKGQCPQCTHCGRFYRPGDEGRPIEINYCDKCQEQEGTTWTSETISEVNAGWRCGKCYVREPQKDASEKRT